VTLRVLIVGANGQDGRILTQIALERGDFVVGIVRQQAHTFEKSPNFRLLMNSFINDNECRLVLDKIQPDIIFHVAASHTNSSLMADFQGKHSPAIFSVAVDITRNILNWQIRNSHSKSVIALSSHMFSGIKGKHLVNENCLPSPVTDYGQAKTESFALIKNYRESFGVNSSAAILFNHTSILGRKDFIYPILANQISEVVLNKRRDISIRNFEAKLDISDAREICEATYEIPQYSPPGDFVLGSGQAEKIGTIVSKVLNHFKVSADTHMISTEKATATDSFLVSDIRKARTILGWSPKIDATDLLVNLVTAQLYHQKTEA